jgi:hypothetical protein
MDGWFYTWKDKYTNGGTGRQKERWTGRQMDIQRLMEDRQTEWTDR